jgi:fructan beta-fructosidase
MSNWDYAQDVPTSPWRSAMTVPRELLLTKFGDDFAVKSRVVPEIASIVSETRTIPELTIDGSSDPDVEGRLDFSRSMISFSFDAKDITIEFSNKKGQRIIVGFDEARNRYFIDRSKSGKIDFSGKFRGDIFAPRLSSASKISCTIIADVSSLEVFFDDGLTVMTSVFFPDEPLSRMELKSPRTNKIENLTMQQLASVWKQ